VSPLADGRSANCFFLYRPSERPEAELETSSSTGTPAVRFAIQSFTSDVTQRDERPNFLGFGKPPDCWAER